MSLDFPFVLTNRRTAAQHKHADNSGPKSSIASFPVFIKPALHSHQTIKNNTALIYRSEFHRSNKNPCHTTQKAHPKPDGPFGSNGEMSVGGQPSLTPNFFRMVIIGHQLVKALWNRLRPTKAVKKSQYFE